MIRGSIRIVFVMLMALAFLSCGGSTRTEDVAKKYLDAWKTYDIGTLTEMTAPDVILDFGRGTLAGREHIIASVEYSAGAKSILEFNNIVVRGDTVEFEMVERNDIITACDFDALQHYPRLIFENGLLVRKGTVRDIPRVRLYVEGMALLRLWIADSRPDILEKITNDKGVYKINRETGELMSLMARAWQESKLIE